MDDFNDGYPTRTKSQQDVLYREGIKKRLQLTAFFKIQYGT
jgi:hypothetical protein